MSELYGVNDELPPDIADVILDDDKEETADNVDESEDGE